MEVAFVGKGCPFSDNYLERESGLSSPMLMPRQCRPAWDSDQNSRCLFCNISCKLSCSCAGGDARLVVEWGDARFVLALRNTARWSPPFQHVLAMLSHGCTSPVHAMGIGTTSAPTALAWGQWWAFSSGRPLRILGEVPLFVARHTRADTGDDVDNLSISFMEAAPGRFAFLSWYQTGSSLVPAAPSDRARTPLAPPSSTRHLD